MKKAAFLLLGVIALAVLLAGCSFSFWALPKPPKVTTPIVRIGPPGTINRPLIGGGDDWHVIPRERTFLDWRTRTDQFGNPTGLLDDTAWRVVDATIRCSEKSVGDTVYSPPYRMGMFWADEFNNCCIWYPTWTGPIEPISGRPYSPYPEAGYPFDPCWFDDRPCVYVAPQTALITARATTDHIWIRIIAPDYGRGTYILDLPGATPQDSNVFELAVGKAGNIDVIWDDGAGTLKVHTVTVPTAWFWVSGSWTIPVGATVTVD